MNIEELKANLSKIKVKEIDAESLTTFIFQELSRLFHQEENYKELLENLNNITISIANKHKKWSMAYIPEYKIIISNDPKYQFQYYLPEMNIKEENGEIDYKGLIWKIPINIYDKHKKDKIWVFHSFISKETIKQRCRSKNQSLLDFLYLGIRTKNKEKILKENEWHFNMLLSEIENIKSNKNQ